MIIANLAVRERWAWYLNLAIAGGSVALVAIVGLGGLLSALAGGHSPAGAEILLISAALAAPILFSRPRRALASVLPIDPASPLTILSLVAVALIVGLQANYQASNDALAAVSRSPQLQPIDVVAQEIPMLLIAVFAVGLFTRRSPRDVLVRLGIVRPAPWQVFAALAVAGLFFAVSQGADSLQQALFPELSRRLNAATSHYYAGIGGWAGIGAIALAPGIAEESLFRGALQPRIGIVLAAIAFTAVHTQYAVTLDTLLVFTLGCGLGLVRSRLNTTSSMTTHAGYNALAGVGIATFLLPWAIAAEAILIALAAGLWWLARRPRTQAEVS